MEGGRERSVKVCKVREREKSEFMASKFNTISSQMFMECTPRE